MNHHQIFVHLNCKSNVIFIHPFHNAPDRNLPLLFPINTGDSIAILPAITSKLCMTSSLYIRILPYVQVNLSDF